MHIREIQAQWLLGLIPPERLPEIAMNALEIGLDNTSWRILASSTTSALDEASLLFQTALKQSGFENMTTKEAMSIYVHFISYQIVENEIDPYAGARKIWDVSVNFPNEKFVEVDPFIYAASEYEDRILDRPFFNEEIRKMARTYFPKFIN